VPKLRSQLNGLAELDRLLEVTFVLGEITGPMWPLGLTYARRRSLMLQVPDGIDVVFDRKAKQANGATRKVSELPEVAEA
jgi:hypothetical protein